MVHSYQGRKKNIKPKFTSTYLTSSQIRAFSTLQVGQQKPNT